MRTPSTDIFGPVEENNDEKIEVEEQEEQEEVQEKQEEEEPEEEETSSSKEEEEADDDCCQYFNSTTFVVFDHNLFLKTNQLLQERTKILHDQKPCTRIRVTKLNYSVLYVMST